MQATVQQPQRAPDGTPVHYERHRPERTKLVTPVLQVVHRVITRHLLGQAGGKVEGADEADSGAVTLIQRFGAAANLNSQKVLTVQGGLQGMPRETDFKQTLCADIDGFSLHAAVRCGADDRQALEQLCRIQRHSVSINRAAPMTGVSTVNTEQAKVLAALNVKKPETNAQMSLL